MLIIILFNIYLLVSLFGISMETCGYIKIWLGFPGSEEGLTFWLLHLNSFNGTDYLFIFMNSHMCPHRSGIMVGAQPLTNGSYFYCIVSTYIWNQKRKKKKKNRQKET